MPVGDPFSGRQRSEIERALKIAESSSGARFSLYVGELGEPGRAGARERAFGLHAQLPEPDVRVLVAIDPAGRQLEIVTGGEVRRRLDDRACALAAATMTSAFAGGDLVGGILAGLQMLGEHARSPRGEHTQVKVSSLDHPR